MSICVLGDSVAKGVVYDEKREKYVFSKNGFANLFSQEEHITIKNLAKFGCTTTKAAKILEANASHLMDSEYTVIELGGNDCDFDWSRIAESPDSFHLPNVPLPQFRSLYCDIIEKVEALGSHPVLLALPPLDPDRFFSWVSKGLNKENILKFLKEVDFIYRWHEAYNIQLFEIAKEYHVPIIDIRSEFLKTKNYRDYLCIDGMHPNEKGHQLILKTLREFVSGNKESITIRS